MKILPPSLNTESGSLLGRTLDDKYRLDELLSSGKISSVYSATHLLINRPVAVKVLNPNHVEDDNAIESLRRAARAMGRVHHLNVIASSDFGRTEDGLVYLVMELLEGHTLRETLAREGKLEVIRAISLMNQISAGVGAIHDAGIIHRNIKPANIFIVQRKHAPYTVKVFNFGIAKLPPDAKGTEVKNITQTGVMIGTPRYMSPEQCDGAELTPASDVYSLGVLLYEMLTGTTPFSGPTPLAVALKHSSEMPKPPRELVATIPEDIESLVLHALEKRPEIRPRNGDAFREELIKVSERLGLDNAAIAEQRVRESLAQLNYQEAIRHASTAITLNPDSADRLRMEFGFILDSVDDTGLPVIASDNRQDLLRWQTRVWHILCEYNDFEPALLKETPVNAGSTISQELQESKPILRKQATTLPERRGEILEEAVLRLFEVFFRLGDSSQEVLNSIRKQRRGTQFGFDIGFECVLEQNVGIRCHVECKNLSKEITLKDIADKLIAQNHFDKDIDLWILISPRANPSNELNQILERWKLEPQYPFDIHVWCPSTGVEEFFGLEPTIYDEFYKTADKRTHPLKWEEAKRASIRERWRQKLLPPLRLPIGWDKYLRNPHFLCISRENPKALDITFSSHVPMQCRNEASVLMPQPLEYYVREWLTQPDKPVFFLLGEFGDGKTFFTYVLARKLAAEFLEDPKSGWIPLRLPLRDFLTAGTSRNFLRQRLEEFGADMQGWTSLHANQRLLVILDGFDEMSKSLDPATITKNIAALLKCYEEFEGCKVMITSRTHFFERWQDVRQLTTRLDDPMRYYLAPIPRRITINHLEETAKQLSLQQSISKLHKLHDPIGLAAKPLFLQMLKDTLHDLPENLDEISLYERYVLNSLSRKADQLDDENLKTSRDELLTNLILLLEELAVEFQVSEQEYISLSRFAKVRQKGFAELLWKMIGSNVDQEDAKARVGVRSLLSRVDVPDIESEWAVDFCHRSIKEYFVARSLCSAVLRSVDDGEKFLRDVPVNHEILDFAATLMRKRDTRQYLDTLLCLIQRATPMNDPGNLGGNTLTLLYRISPILPESDWTGKIFDFADIEGADLSGRIFRRSSFRFADLTNVNFEDANFEECDLTGVRIEETAAVTSLAVFPSTEKILAAYRDGTAREWSLHHPRKSESRLVASQLPRQQIILGILRNGRAWMRDAGNFTFFNSTQNSEMRQIAKFPVKTSYRLESPTDTEMLIVKDDIDGRAKVQMINLERQGITNSSEVSSVTLCTSLANDTFVIYGGADSLRIIKMGLDNEETSLVVPSGPITCLSSAYIQEYVYVIVCGQDSGKVQAWIVNLCQRPWISRKIFDNRLHTGLVTAVTLLDDSRIASGGQDRAIVITRIDTEGKLPLGIIERKLQLTLRCKGMRINGLKGPDEQRKLSEFIIKAEIEN